MEQKINIAELLKDCPSGMELDSTIMENVYFDEVLNNSIKCYYIKNSTKIRSTVYFNKFGEYFGIENGKCVIFPKGKTTWEGFVPPIQFKDGDVIANNAYIAIFHKLDKIPYSVRNDVVYYHCLYRKGNGYSKFKIDFGIGYESNFRLATEEEKAKLFQAIKDNGYKWNAETKTLEKLPKFKVGDEIYERNSISNSWIVNSVSSEYYGLKLPNGFEGIGVLPVSEQDDWVLVPDKFDINTLKPFDKVLVRDFDNTPWEIELFSRLLDGKHFKCLDISYMQCIPYEENKHLLGTTDDCDEFYKNW